MDILDKPFNYDVKVEGQGDTPKEIVETCQTLTDLHELIHDLGGDVVIKSMQGVDFRYLKIIA